MADVVIRAENLGKKFIIGHKVERDGLLRDAITTGARSLLRKGADLLKGRPTIAGDNFEEFWALRDVNFEIKSGELVSFIGRNGAGKTTLLKVLSRITEPTTGRVEINGRVNSLLEVGTGFHPELSGRENIFLNGAILGMSQVEMRRRFDEIVEFSGVGKFIDTPVKRYSVGMYVRLAFAVAAHLEAEILVIDEVLSVGDAEFQARCLNRMSEVAGSGRTVLFVSHNFAAVTALTKRSIVLQGGRLTFDGPVDAGLAHYTSTLGKTGPDRQWGRGKDATLVSAELLDPQGMPSERFIPGSPLRLRVVVETTGMPGMSLEVILRDQHNLPIAFYSSAAFNQVPLPAQAGRYECTLSLDAYYLAAGDYGIDLQTTQTNIVIDQRIDSAVRFSVDACSPDGIAYNFRQDLGAGHLAMRLTGPLEFVPVAGAKATMPRKVCIVSPGNLASNPRVLKEADALHEAGYGVTAVVCNYTDSLKSFDDDIAAKVPWSVVRVSRLAREPYLQRASSLIAHALLKAALGVPLSVAVGAYGGPAQALWQAARDVPADLYIAHYVAALPGAAAAARHNGGMLGFDAEDFHSGEGTGGPKEEFRMAMVRAVEGACLPSCSYMTTAAPLIGEAYRSLYGVSSTTLLNVFPLDMLSAAPGHEAADRRSGTLRAYWFSQTIGPDRGLQEFMHAMARAKTRVSLDIRGGDRSGHGDALMALARNLGVAERVRLLPLAPPEEMANLAVPYDIGLSLETGATESRRRCLTNKIFTYLLAGVPVMMSDTPAQSALAPDLGEAAALVSLADPGSMAQALDRLAGSPEALDKAKAAALRLGRQRYNWDVEKQVLLDSVERVFAQGSRA